MPLQCVSSRRNDAGRYCPTPGWDRRYKARSPPATAFISVCFSSRSILRAGVTIACAGKRSTRSSIRASSHRRPVSIRGNPGVYIHALTDIAPAEGALLMTESSTVSKRQIATLCTGPRPGIGKIPGGSDASRRVMCTRSQSNTPTLATHESWLFRSNRSSALYSPSPKICHRGLDVAPRAEILKTA